MPRYTDILPLLSSFIVLFIPQRLAFTTITIKSIVSLQNPKLRNNAIRYSAFQPELSDPYWSNDTVTNTWEMDENHENDFEDMTDNPFLEEYKQWCVAIDHAIAQLEKKKNSLENELRKAEKIEDTFKRAQLITTYLYMFTPGTRSVVVQDWENDGKEVELKLDDKYNSANEEADALFRQARKLKRGSQVVGKLLDETKEALETLTETRTDLVSALQENEEINVSLLRLVQDRLIRTSRTTGFQPPVSETTNDQSNSGRRQSTRALKPAVGTPASNIRKLQSPGGCTVLVGRNRRGNEHLSFSLAKGDDIWMHSRGSPGAHVLILQRRGGPSATEDCLQFAADVAVFYSDARSERKADVTLCEPKHILKPRNAPLGAVKLREELKVMTGFPDQVPLELKEAREESGQDQDFRTRDKAKHRRRTREAAAAKQSKKKRREKSNND